MIRAVLLALVLLAAFPARGQEAVRVPVGAVIARAQAWIAARTLYRPALPPPVVFVPEAHIRARHGEGHVRAMYDPLFGAILLAESWDETSLLDLSILIHELVHHLQARHNVPYRCWAESEPEAYAVQAAFLAANGVRDPWAFLGADPALIQARATCPGKETPP